MSDYLLSVWPIEDSHTQVRLSCIPLKADVPEPAPAYTTTRPELRLRLHKTVVCEQVEDLILRTDRDDPVHVQISEQDARVLRFLPQVN